MRTQTESDVRSLLRAARERLDVEIAYFTQFTAGVQEISFLEGDADAFAFGEGTSIPLERTYCRRMIEGAAPAVVPVATLEPAMSDLAVGKALGCYVGVPVRLSDGRIYGTLCCAAADAREGLDESDEAYVQALADQLAGMVEARGGTDAAVAVGAGTIELTLWFAGMTRAPGSARSALGVLEAEIGADRLQALQLVITELVTNSLRHAGIGDRDVIGVEVAIDGDLMRCSVSDSGEGFERPDVVRPHADRPGGFGLVILDSVAESWELSRDGLFRVSFAMRL